MLLEIGKGARPPVILKVRRCRTDYAAVAGHASRHQTRVVQGADAHCNIDAGLE
jgi:hypothetical protein